MQRGRLIPFLFALDQADCRGVAPHLLSAPSDLPHRSDATHTLSWRWPGSNLEPLNYKANVLRTDLQYKLIIILLTRRDIICALLRDKLFSYPEVKITKKQSKGVRILLFRH